MDATHMSYGDNSVSSASLQCAYELFIRDGDIKLIRELGRILKKGGKVVICPLYMRTDYSGFSGPSYYFKKEYHAVGAKVYLAHRNTLDVPFSRSYDVKRLKERVLDTAKANQLDFNLYVLRNGKEIGPNVYCHFVLEIMKE